LEVPVKLTGSQVFAKELKALGIHYVAGIPGQGSWALVDGLLAPGMAIPFIQVMQEQSAVHMADGYFRACGRPMAALLPTSLGRSKALGGIETARVDGSAILVISAGAPEPAATVLFESSTDTQSAAAPGLKAGKSRLAVTSADKLSATLRKAFDSMLSSLAGPVIIDIPVRVQTDSIEAKGASRRQASLGEPVSLNVDVLEQIAEQVSQAQRPVILAGSGVIADEAGAQLLLLAEAFLLPVVTTTLAKGAFPEDHLLSGATLGRQSRDAGNALLSAADLLIAIGCARDSEVMPTLPGARLTHMTDAALILIDSSDPATGSGKLAGISLSTGLKEALQHLAQLPDAPARKALKLHRGPYRKAIAARCKARDSRLDASLAIDLTPLPVQRPLRELRLLLERDAIVVVGAGSVQAAVRQVFPVYMPRSHLCVGGAGAVGWAVPAAIGAKLAMPARQVVCVVGDGDFLQSMQEMAVCMMHTIPVVFVVLNNSGYASMSELQLERNENHPGGEFNLPDGRPYSPDFAVIARSFGLEAWRVEHGSQLKAVLSKAINSKGPSLVEIITARGNVAVHD
jgi:acetolactate synthase-1/2/3 large subunit